MRWNENIAISTSRVLLVPYDRHHVPTYHSWMEDPDIREATASERLTLEEEYENQESWRASHDKLTFIICQPVEGELLPPEEEGLGDAVDAGVFDAPEQMVGDVNFFLYPHDEGEDEEDEHGNSGGGGGAARRAGPQTFVGEVDVMVASRAQRGQGIGTAVVAAFLYYIRRNLAHILEEHRTRGGEEDPHASEPPQELVLKQFMVKIKADNEASVKLFSRLGFQQEGDVNYFGEIKLVLRDIDSLVESPPPGYKVVRYRRSPGSR